LVIQIIENPKREDQGLNIMLEIIEFRLGPVETNAYLIADSRYSDAVVIDPAWDGEKIAITANQRGWQIQQIWLTHAHFDHLAGGSGLAATVQPSPPVALHSLDLPLWEMNGGAALFGFRINPGPAPTIKLEKTISLRVGEIEFEVRHTPGHTPGHVIFYSAEEEVVFCGDVIFAGGIGRTDLPGGNFNQLMDSIGSQILNLPNDVRLLSGHGPATTVGEERIHNPFLTTFG
jgi:hydroxyacylglutathione hydrolase